MAVAEGGRSEGELDGGQAGDAGVPGAEEEVDGRVEHKLLLSQVLYSMHLGYPSLTSRFRLVRQSLLEWTTELLASTAA